MAVEMPIVTLSLIAGEDLSAKQYYFVKISAANTVVCCAAVTDIPIGVLQNKPESGELAEVMAIGITKLSADAAIALPAPIGSSADGQAAKYAAGTDTTKYIVGQALTAAGAGDEIFTAFINCGYVARGQ